MKLFKFALVALFAASASADNLRSAKPDEIEEEEDEIDVQHFDVESNFHMGRRRGGRDRNLYDKERYHYYHDHDDLEDKIFKAALRYDQNCDKSVRKDMKKFGGYFDVEYFDKKGRKSGGSRAGYGHGYGWEYRHDNGYGHKHYQDGYWRKLLAEPEDADRELHESDRNHIHVPSQLIPNPPPHPSPSPPNPAPSPTACPAYTLCFKGDDGKPKRHFPLSVCEGDCDSDNDCESGLKCFKREKKEPVPGCNGRGKYGKDYCYDPGDHPSPPSGWVPSPPHPSPSPPTNEACPLPDGHDPYRLWSKSDSGDRNKQTLEWAICNCKKLSIWDIAMLVSVDNFTSREERECKKDCRDDEPDDYDRCKKMECDCFKQCDKKYDTWKNYDKCADKCVYYPKPTRNPTRGPTPNPSPGLTPQPTKNPTPRPSEFPSSSPV